MGSLSFSATFRFYPIPYLWHISPPVRTTLHSCHTAGWRLCAHWELHNLAHRCKAAHLPSHTQSGPVDERLEMTAGRHKAHLSTSNRDMHLDEKSHSTHKVENQRTMMLCPLSIAQCGKYPTLDHHYLISEQKWTLLTIVYFYSNAKSIFYFVFDKWHATFHFSYLLSECKKRNIFLMHSDDIYCNTV